MYIIQTIQGAAGANRPTGSMSKVALEPTIAISAIAAELAPGGGALPSAARGHRATRHRSDHEFAGQLRLQEEEKE